MSASAIPAAISAAATKSALAGSSRSRYRKNAEEDDVEAKRLEDR